MPEYVHLAKPVEWLVGSPRQQGPGAIIRRLALGREADTYYRVVTWADDPAQRELIGYWGTLEEAARNAVAVFEKDMPSSWLSSPNGFRERVTGTPQKPPPRN